MRTVINSVDVGAHCPQFTAQPLMHGIQPIGDTTLVANDNHAKTGSIQQSNCFNDPGNNVHLLPAGYVLVFGRSFSVYNAVTIEERGFVHEILSLPPALK